MPRIFKKLITTPQGMVGRSKLYIGIDPGASGGLVSLVPLSEGPRAELTVAAMPDDDWEIWKWLNDWKYFDDRFAVIEKVSGFAGVGHPGSAMFKFGRSYGALRMALTAASIPFEEVSPQTWQRGLKIPQRTHKETRGVWKNRLKQKARQLFPEVNVTLAIADALLIAEYARRRREGCL